MFKTFDSESFKIVEEIHNSSQELVNEGERPFFINKVKCKRFLGPAARSAKGCINCRARKKKCDEIHPVCGYCTKRGLECSWRDNLRKSRKTEPVSDKLPPSKRKAICPPEGQNAQASTTKDAEDSLSSFFSKSQDINIEEDLIKKLTEFKNTIFVPYFQRALSTAGLTENGLAAIPDPEAFKSVNMDGELITTNRIPYTEIPIQFLISPKIKSDLGNQDLFYLEYFVYSYSMDISISPRSSNYFIETFLQLAYSNEAILYSLVAWGCLMKKSKECSKEYMYRAARLIYNKFGNAKKRSSTEMYILISFYLIAIGWEVCSGDTYNWFELSRQCKSLINDYGGLQKLHRDFNGSNHIVWLISDFQYHDVLSSEAHREGTLFPIDIYRSMLKDDKDYGLDPLQGCIRPLYLILGEIINCSVELKEEWSIIETQMSEVAKASRESVNELRLEYYLKCQSKAAYFMEEVENCSPTEFIVNILKDDLDEMELQMTLFELYSYITSMYVGTYIKKLPPCSFEQQSILLKCLRIIDILMNTRMVVSLSFSLLVAGIHCCTEMDRLRMLERFENMSQRYTVGNFAKVVEIVQESWEINPHGLFSVDWTQIAKNKGWVLYIG